MSKTVRSLHAVPEGWLSSTFLLFEGETEVARLCLARFWQTAELYVDDEFFKLEREGFWGDYGMSRAGVRVVRATKPSMWSTRFEVRHGDDAYEFHSPLFTSAFDLTRGSEHLGRLQRDGLFTRKATLTLSRPVPRDLAFFVVWLGLVIFRRRRQGHSSGG